MTPAIADLPARVPVASSRGPVPLQDGAPSPSDRAEHFAAYLPRLSPSEWDDVVKRVHAVDAAAHAAAIHRVADVLHTHPNINALNAL